jgi:hypothetical protein
MKVQINIAIIGLSLNITNQIKSLFTLALSHSYPISWTNIANKNLDLLVIGESFQDSQTIINIRNNNIKSLIVKNNDFEKNIIIKNEIFFHFEDLPQLREWFNNNIDIKNKKQLRSNINNKTDLEIVKENIINPISNYLLCTINDKYQFIIDFKLQEVWVPQAQKFEIIHNISFEDLSFNRAVNLRNKIDKYDLKIWLWNFLWMYLESTPPIKQQNYILTNWPQPNHKIPKSILKISSCFQHGANVNEVQSYLALEKEFLERYIYVSCICGILQITPESNISFKVHTEEANENTIHSFFKKLRRKLGI